MPEIGDIYTNEFNMSVSPATHRFFFCVQIWCLTLLFTKQELFSLQNLNYQSDLFFFNPGQKLAIYILMNLICLCPLLRIGSFSVHKFGAWPFYLPNRSSSLSKTSIIRVISSFSSQGRLLFLSDLEHCDSDSIVVVDLLCRRCLQTPISRTNCF